MPIGNSYIPETLITKGMKKVDHPPCANPSRRGVLSPGSIDRRTSTNQIPIKYAPGGLLQMMRNNPSRLLLSSKAFFLGHGICGTRINPLTRHQK